MRSGWQMEVAVALMGLCPAFSLACTAALFMVVMYSFATFCIRTLQPTSTLSTCSCRKYGLPSALPALLQPSWWSCTPSQPSASEPCSQPAHCQHARVANIACLQPRLYRCILQGGHVLLCNLLHQDSAANQDIINMLVSQIWPALYQPKKQCSCLEPVLDTALEQQLVLSMSQSGPTSLSASPRLQLIMKQTGPQ